MKIGRRAVRNAAMAFVAACLAAGASAVRADAAGAVDPVDDLYGVSFASAQEGWLSGAFGTIFHTRDGGKTWHTQASGTTEGLFDIDFVDNDEGWVVGRLGTILHTGNGGATWKRQKSGTGKHLLSVDFVNRKFGCAVGDWGLILLTRDGGATWQSKPFGEDVILNDISMVDTSRGWIVGEMGTILKTEDGCVTWTKQESGVPKTLFGVAFVDAQRGWAVGIDGLILHTEDGGATWKAQHGSTELGALAQVGFVEAYDRPSLYGVAVVGGRGFVAGDIGAIFASTDGGGSWKRRDLSYKAGLSWLRALAVLPGGDGAIVGAHGHRVMIVKGRLEPVSR